MKEKGKKRKGKEKSKKEKSSSQISDMDNQCLTKGQKKKQHSKTKQLCGKHLNRTSPITNLQYRNIASEVNNAIPFKQTHCQYYSIEYTLSSGMYRWLRLHKFAQKQHTQKKFKKLGTSV